MGRGSAHAWIGRGADTGLPPFADAGGQRDRRAGGVRGQGQTTRAASFADGCHPVIVRTQSRARVLPTTPGKRRRSSTMADSSPSSANTRRIAAAVASSTANISRPWPPLGPRRKHLLAYKAHNPVRCSPSAPRAAAIRRAAVAFEPRRGERDRAVRKPRSDGLGDLPRTPNGPAGYLGLGIRRLPPQANRLGKRRAGLGIVRRHHRLVGWEAPFRAILLRRQAIGRVQMPLEHFELLAVL